MALPTSEGIENIFRTLRRLTNKGTENKTVSIERIFQQAVQAARTSFKGVRQAAISQRLLPTGGLGLSFAHISAVQRSVSGFRRLKHGSGGRLFRASVLDTRSGRRLHGWAGASDQAAPPRGPKGTVQRGLAEMRAKAFPGLQLARPASSRSQSPRMSWKSSSDCPAQSGGGRRPLCLPQTVAASPRIGKGAGWRQALFGVLQTVIFMLFRVVAREARGWALEVLG